MNHLKANGQKYTIMSHIEEWISNNLDDLFQDQGLRQYFVVDEKTNIKDIDKSIRAKSEEGKKTNFKN